MIFFASMIKFLYFRKKIRDILENNKIHRVVILVTTCFLLYFLFSIGANIFNLKWEAFERINLISEVVKKEEPSKNIPQKVSTLPTEKETKIDFNLYQKPEYITNFIQGDSVLALPQFAEKLHLLKQRGKGKIRIAFLGDSMIEGDLITQTLRQLLQQEFGGSGVGYLPLFSNVAGFRQTAKIQSSAWQDIHFKSDNAKNIYLSGHIFTGKGEGVYEDRTLKNAPIIEKSLIFGKTDGAEMNIDGQNVRIVGNQLVNKKLLSKSNSPSMHLKSHSANTPLYGISFESENGIIVDNFSFRGITGVELKKIDEEFFRSIQKANAYDLIVFQYGVNLLYRPKDTDYSYYEKMITPVFTTMKKAFPDTEFLLISSSDKAFRYDGKYQTAIGIPSLIELQAKLAMEHQFAFYNQFASMGGENSIVKWAEAEPPLANKDYTHPNFRGAEILAQKLFSAMMKDYKKYHKKNNQP